MSNANSTSRDWNLAGKVVPRPPALPPIFALPDNLQEEHDRRSERFFTRQALPSWFISTLVHALILLGLMWLTIPGRVRPGDNSLVLGAYEAIEDVDFFEGQAIQIDDVPATEDSIDALVNDEQLSIAVESISLDEPPTVAVKLDPLGDRTARHLDWAAKLGGLSGGALSGRTAAAKARLLREAGGTPGSEAAVVGGLQWLANHQLKDGGWSLNHKLHPDCNGQCPDVGTRIACRFGATGLALLPFLGAGQTHQEGEHQEVVQAGLDFLVRHIQSVGDRGRLVDKGNYYSHGICAIVLCEAYALTHDKKLQQPAQSLINEIAWAQDPAGGGWRYAPQSPGDTSMTGWQLMALKSANMAYLQIPRPTVPAALRFLDSVQVDEGALYRYMPGFNPTRSATSIGLLCRMYTGWQPENASLQAGVAVLDREGPDVGQNVDDQIRQDMYYNYYATQVMRHYGGPRWTEWNNSLRDFLVESQEREGHVAGSWYFHAVVPGDANEVGGRLFCTSLCTMILEVYYRHLPLYQKQAADDNFPL